MPELSAREKLEAMIAGTHEDELIEDEGVNEEEVEVDEAQEQEPEVEEGSDTEDGSAEEELDTDTETDEDEDGEGDIEDTDQGADTDGEEDTTEQDDGSAEDTSETDGEDLGENSQDEAEQSKDESDEPNYKEFYEKVALAKFTANGREQEGFKDPEDLIRAQQMLHGFSDKMKVVKEYQPFIKALKERGITEDSDKFNLAMSLLDGDTEAFKKVLKEKEIDPLELDLDNVKYTPKNTLPSEAQLVVEEAYEQAENLGVGDKFNKVVSKDWDVASLQELVSNGAVRNDLVQHLKDGTYDLVQNEVSRMELLDSTGSLSGMSSVDKYRAAMVRLQQRQAPAPVVETPAKKEEAPAVDPVEEQKKVAEKAEFKKKAEAKEKAAAEARKKAAAVSKKKKATKNIATPKMEALPKDKFKAAFDEMLMG